MGLTAVASEKEYDRGARLQVSYEDIPLVQYFTERVALWHQRFGHPASHGCIKPGPADAERLFAFTSPALATGDADVWVKALGRSTALRVRGPATP